MKITVNVERPSVYLKKGENLTLEGIKRGRQAWDKLVPVCGSLFGRLKKDKKSK